MRKTTCVLLLIIMLSMAAQAAAETLTLSLLGDCTVGTIRYKEGKSSFTSLIKELGMDYPFSGFSEMFKADDFTLANCEVVFTNKKTPSKKEKTNLYATPEWAKVFTLGGVDAVNTENNHTFDFGRQGRLDTLEALDAEGIPHFGGGELLVLDVKGVKIGMTGYTYPHRYDLTRQEKDIKALRAMGCDLVIVSMHWGREENPKPTKEQLALGPQLIDLGADIVYGHGPHVLQPIEIYKGKPIFYSLANFTFGGNANPKDADTAIISLEYEMSEGEITLSRLTAYPAKMHNKKDFRPYLVTDEALAQKIFKKLSLDETGILDFN